MDDMADFGVWARQDQVGDVPGGDFAGRYSVSQSLDSGTGFSLRIPQRIDGSCDMIVGEK